GGLVAVFDEDHKYTVAPLESELDELTAGDLMDLSFTLAGDPLLQSLLPTLVSLARTGRTEVMAESAARHLVQAVAGSAVEQLLGRHIKVDHPLCSGERYQRTEENGKNRKIRGSPFENRVRFHLL